MLPDLRLNEEYFETLMAWDEELARCVAAACCPHCGGPLHRASATAVAATQLLLVAACGASALDRASATYRREHDCPSLEAIAQHVKGTTASQVQALLGPAQYEPTPGQHYYSSSRADCSLVLDYRHGDQLTDTVQTVEVGAIGE